MLHEPRTRNTVVRLVALAAFLIAAFLPASASASTSTSFTTPGTYNFTVPSGVTGLRISATGAGGGAYATPSCPAGKGGNVQATISVTPGSTLAIVVAGQGGSTSTGAGGQGGFGGGGNGGSVSEEGGGGGGGASRVSLGGNPLVVGAGGGGCGTFSNAPSQPDGHGGDDQAPGGSDIATGGGPGTQTTGGTGGTSSTTTDPEGGNGTAGQGGSGAGTPPQNGGGGGGGGGYFGGGGGGGVRAGGATAGGGGGGSDHTVAGASTVTTTSGTNAGNGQVTITYFTVTQPTISGKTEVGKSLAVHPGTATGGGSPSYQWLRGSGSTFTPIPGATGSTYKLAKADRGKRIEVRETVSDSGGSATATSNPTGVIGPPLVRTRARKTQRAVKQRGVVVKVKSNLAGKATATIALPKGIAKTLRFKRVTRSLTAGKFKTLKLKLSKKDFATLKRVLVGKRTLKARLTLVIKDKNSGRTTKKITVTLKR